VKVVFGLGNPGSEYERTRHNVAWWLLDELQKQWRFEPFRRVGRTHATEGLFEGQPVRLIKPLTYVNRSGSALFSLRDDPTFDFSKQLLVVVDDVALPVGKYRVRPNGSAGGHNGLKSIEGFLQSQDYARLRIGVGSAPPDVDLADWVLSPMEADDEKQVRELIPALADEVRSWLLKPVEPDVPDAPL
jgi:peptidyl-tRNA hydrolase, PTH1 family